MMKQKNAYILLLLAALLLALNIQSQNIVLRLQGGTDQTVLLNNLQKITFSNDNLVLNYLSGATQSFSFSNLDKLFFTPLTSVDQERTPKENILFNSLDNQIHFRNLPEGKYRVTVYRMDGVALIKTTISNNEAIDMSRFPSNIYLIRINNQILKFKK